MAYTVEFSVRARRDIDEIVGYIQSDSRIEATRWREQLNEKLLALRAMPDACGLAPENDYSRLEVRQLLCGQYRVLFAVRSSAVVVITIRHGARRFLSRSEIDAIE